MCETDKILILLFWFIIMRVAYKPGIGRSEPNKRLIIIRFIIMCVAYKPGIGMSEPN